MRTGKIVLRSAIIGFVSVLCAFALLVGMMTVFYPKTLFRFTNGLEWNDVSLYLAKRAYDKDGEIEMLDTAFCLAVETGDVKSTEELATKLLSHPSFPSYAAKQDAIEESGTTYGEKYGLYKEYVQAELTVAKYKNGNVSGAIEYAYNSVLYGFSKNNAVIKLTLAIVENGDETSANSLLQKLSSRSYKNQEDKTRLDGVRSLLNGVKQGN